MVFSLLRGAAFKKPADYWPFQGDDVTIVGDVCEVFDGEDVRNHAGQVGRFVWKMRGFPELPVRTRYADQRLTLVGDATVFFSTMILPIDWPEQEGLDLALRAPVENVVAHVAKEDRERRTSEAFHRQAVAAFSRAFIEIGMDPNKDRWMLQPAPLESLRLRAFELAEVFMDAILDEDPDNFELVESLGVTVHRDWPVIMHYEKTPEELLTAEHVVHCALDGGKEAGARARGAGRGAPRKLFVPDWSDVDVTAMLREAVGG